MSITGRDGIIIAKALFVASRYMKRQKHPELSDIADMEAILEKHFPQQAKSLALFDDVKTAARLGVFADSEAGKSFAPEELRALIAAKTSHNNVVEF